MLALVLIDRFKLVVQQSQFDLASESVANRPAKVEMFVDNLKVLQVSVFTLFP